MRSCEMEILHQKIEWVSERERNESLPAVMALSGSARPVAAWPLLNIMGAMIDGSEMAVVVPREALVSGMKVWPDMIMAAAMASGAASSGFSPAVRPLVAGMGAVLPSLAQLLFGW